VRGKTSVVRSKVVEGIWVVDTQIGKVLD